MAWASLNPAASLVGLYRDFMQWDWQALLVRRSQLMMTGLFSVVGTY